MIANAAECVASAHRYDGLVGLHNCDKNGPGFAMALARLNYPGLIVSGGSIQPGSHRGRDVTILDSYDAQAAASVGSLDQSEADEIIRVACPGPGGCGIAASFNTWGICMEAIGLMLPSSSSNPAVSAEKEAECAEVGNAMQRLLELDLRPRDILTPRSFRNAMVTIAAAGGSTNGILHLLALARESGVSFGLLDVQAVARETPVLCNFAPRGSHTMIDLYRMGGTPVLLKHLFSAGLLDGDCVTVTGKTLAENLEGVAPVAKEQELIAPVNAPFKEYADLQVCLGNLAPDGIVFKVSSMQNPTFRGVAICFDSAREVFEAVQARKVRPGHVCVLRYLGPVASGMPEVLVATAALSVPELDGKVAFVSDTRVSGVSHGAIGVHCAPEAAAGGPIALVEDGDEISLDLMRGDITLHVGDSELDDRRRRWKPPPSTVGRHYLADFAATVTQANDGCVSRSVPALPSSYRIATGFPGDPVAPLIGTGLKKNANS